MNTEKDRVIGNIEDACDRAGEADITGVRLDVPGPELLDVRNGLFDEHVAMQPAAIAYYGVLKKTAARELQIAQREFEHWKKRKYQEARKGLEAQTTKKVTIGDIEAYMFLQNEAQIREKESAIDKLQSQSDTMDTWYEAWRQKSYALREHGLTLSDERRSQPYIYGKTDEEEDTGVRGEFVEVDAPASRISGRQAMRNIREMQKKAKKRTGAC